MMRETVYHISGAPHFALLTDIHNGPYDAVIASLQQHRPRYLFIAGDTVYGYHPLTEQKNVLPFLRACAEQAPTFLSLGNHEQFLSAREIREMKRTGVTVLDNSWVEKEGLIIGGLTSAYVTERRKYGDRHDGRREHRPDLTWLKQFSATPGYHILLSHHPEYWPMIRDLGIELVLCGHAHGGQIQYWNPFVRNDGEGREWMGRKPGGRRGRWCGVFAPGQGLWPKYTRGVYEGRMVVSAGLTNTARVPRICNSTEIVYAGCATKR